MPRPPKGYIYPQRYNDNRLSLGDLFSSSSRINVNQDALKTDAGGNLINPNAPVFSGQRRKFLGFIPYGENPAETANADLAAEDRLQLRSLANQKALAALLSGYRMDENNASSKNRLAEDAAAARDKRKGERQAAKLAIKKEQAAANIDIDKQTKKLQIELQAALNKYFADRGEKPTDEAIAAVAKAANALRNNQYNDAVQAREVNDAMHPGRLTAAGILGRTSVANANRSLNDALIDATFSETPGYSDLRNAGTGASLIKPVTDAVNSSPIFKPGDLQQLNLQPLLRAGGISLELPSRQSGFIPHQEALMEETIAGEGDKKVVQQKPSGHFTTTLTDSLGFIKPVGSNTVDQARAALEAAAAAKGTNNPASVVAPVPDAPTVPVRPTPDRGRPATAPATAPIIPDRGRPTPGVSSLVSPSSAELDTYSQDTPLPKAMQDDLSLRDMALNRIIKGTDMRPEIHKRAQALMAQLGMQPVSEYTKWDIGSGKGVPLNKTTQQLGADLRKDLTTALFGEDNYLNKQKGKPIQSAIDSFRRKREEQNQNAMRQLLSDYYE